MSPTLQRVRIIGAGLIGTSIGLALRNKNIAVEIQDSDAHSQNLASDLVKSVSIPQPDLVVIATPISSILPILKEQYSLNPNSIFLDVGSVKTELQVQIDQISGLSDRYIGTHPMAGREVSGPTGARADLFDGRAWPIVISTKTSSTALQAAQELIALCGASAYEMSAIEHDRTVSFISHLPQILSSLMAGELAELTDLQLNLAGQGLRDVTRLAGSDVAMWLDIFRSNSEFIVHALSSMSEKFDRVLDALTSRDMSRLEEMMVSGKRQRERISGKHGARARNYHYINVVVGDKPGQLGALFIECAKIGVNVEDISLEHSPGQETGLITLALSESDSLQLFSHLAALTWQVYRA